MKVPARRACGYIAVALLLVTTALFVLGVTNRAGGLLGAHTAVQALRQTFVLTLAAAGSTCLTITATMLAIGHRSAPRKKSVNGNAAEEREA